MNQMSLLFNIVELNNIYKDGADLKNPARQDRSVLFQSF